jgi:hypothetical protein
MTATEPTPKLTKAAPAAPTTPSEPSRPENISSGYSLPIDLHDELRTAAKDRGLSASYLVEKALRDYLPRLIPVDELALVRPVAATPPSAGEVAARLQDARRIADDPQA